MNMNNLSLIDLVELAPSGFYLYYVLHGYETLEITLEIVKGSLIRVHLYLRRIYLGMFFHDKRDDNWYTVVGRYECWGKNVAGALYFLINEQPSIKSTYLGLV